MAIVRSRRFDCFPPMARATSFAGVGIRIAIDRESRSNSDVDEVATRARVGRATSRAGARAGDFFRLKPNAN